MSGIVDGLKTVWEAVINLPSLIWGQFKDTLDWIKNYIAELPDKIGEKLVEIFVPDEEEINAKFMAFIREIEMKFGFTTDFFNAPFGTEQPVQDVFIPSYGIPNVGPMPLQVLDTKYFIQGISYFRPFIRGFIVFLLLLYNIHHILGFFRQDAGVIAGKSMDIQMGVQGGARSEHRKRHK